MRVVIDLQAAQSTNSRNRGIGRYSLSLAKAMARNRGQHEILIVLNGMFSDTLASIRSEFDGILPQDNIRVWYSVAPVYAMGTNNTWRRHVAERVRETFINSLSPDVIHVTSVFEGLTDNAVSSINQYFDTAPTAVTLYDLIPYLYRDKYLNNPTVKNWYLEKIEHLKKANLWLAISESSRLEGINYLDLPETRSINISTDADKQFEKLIIEAKLEKSIREKYQLTQPFVMYTGGIDHRKNIEGLIQAYAKLPTPLRKNHQLVIVCSMQTEKKLELVLLAEKQGLKKGEVVFTGFVPDQDLVYLYNLCKLFIFPSSHEGFGLPALEAMRCGAPVIGANATSLPEVIGWKKALFDPYSIDSIRNALEHALTDEQFLKELTQNSQGQEKNFSWDQSAQTAIEALEKLHQENKKTKIAKFTLDHKPRLAYVSPMPPDRSGIAEYSAELIPALARYYDIDVITNCDMDPALSGIQEYGQKSVDWFYENHHFYDRVLYHFGNSTFHQHMFALLEKIPGVTVLHDFFLSGILAHMERQGYSSRCWARELYKSHGYHALRDYIEETDTSKTIFKYPCNLSVIQRSLSLIVHSKSSLTLAKQWHKLDEKKWDVIPLLRKPAVNNTDSARDDLGFSKDDFLVCSFGHIAPTKLNLRLVQAWLTSKLSKNKKCHLIFVGENDAGDYGKKINNLLEKSNTSSSIQITGWLDSTTFHKYLSAADIGVQLRALSRGETSAAALDCMNHGIATIVNSNGSMADLPDEAVWKMPDEFTDAQLIEAIENLWGNDAQRQRIGATAQNIVKEKHSPDMCARQYFNTIEHAYDATNCRLSTLVHAIKNTMAQELGENTIPLADALAKTFHPAQHQPQLLVDVTQLDQYSLTALLKQEAYIRKMGYRLEPIYFCEESGYRYARKRTLMHLKLNIDFSNDELVEFYSVDKLILINDYSADRYNVQSHLENIRAQGVKMVHTTAQNINDIFAISLH